MAKKFAFELSKITKRSIAYDVIENHKHIDISSEALLLIFTSNINRRGFQIDVVSEVEKFLSHDNNVILFTNSEINLYDKFQTNLNKLPKIIKIPFIDELYSPVVFDFYFRRIGRGDGNNACEKRTYELTETYAASSDYDNFADWFNGDNIGDTLDNGVGFAGDNSGCPFWPPFGIPATKLWIQSPDSCSGRIAIPSSKSSPRRQKATFQNRERLLGSVSIQSTDAPFSYHPSYNSIFSSFSNHHRWPYHN